jgi:hypothetical protein
MIKKIDNSCEKYIFLKIKEFLIFLKYLLNN